MLILESHQKQLIEIIEDFDHALVWKKRQVGATSALIHWVTCIGKSSPRRMDVAWYVPTYRVADITADLFNIHDHEKNLATYSHRGVRFRRGSTVDFFQGIYGWEGSRSDIVVNEEAGQMPVQNLIRTMRSGKKSVTTISESWCKQEFHHVTLAMMSISSNFRLTHTKNCEFVIFGVKSR